MQISNFNNEHPKTILIYKLFAHVLLTILHNLFFEDVVKFSH